MIIIWFILLVSFLSVISIFFIRKTTLYKKQIERSLKMVPFLVTVPQGSGQKKAEGGRDERELARELISTAENLYYSLYSVYKNGMKKYFQGQKHMALEIVAEKGEICFYFAVPISMVSLVEKAISSQYPEALIEEVEEHNIFFKEQKASNIFGGELVLRKNPVFPINTYTAMDNEPLEAITNSLSKLEPHEGAAIQILIRPASPKFSAGARSIAKKIQKGEFNQFKLGKAVGELAKAAVTTPKKDEKDFGPKQLTPIVEEAVKRIELKAGKPAFESIIRIIVSADSEIRGQMIQNEVLGSLQQFNDFNLNSFKFRSAKNRENLAANYIFRFFRITNSRKYYLNRFLNKENIAKLNTEELASLFHLPNFLVQTPGIKWLPARKTASPVVLPDEGIILGESIFRGVKKEVRISEDDIRRHAYIIGQTGTGKTNTLKNMILDEIQKGNGVCYIDPHGQDLEDILNKIPKERAEDVILFDAGDIERPMGLNLFDAKTTEQKDFVIQESIQMLYKLYDPGHTGIMGPRFEHWFRNAALAIMADPAGGTFIEVPRIFTDDNYLKEKLKFVTDPIVRNFWISEMGQTTDFHKSEVLGWFVGKFGAFMTNSTMRNILGQTDTTLQIREAMDSGKILLINLAKGKIGEINMSLLGMIFVSKIQMAAMSRVDIPEAERRDFTLYVDEFQNFATDSFAAILSEARKFKLRLVVANQFIGQLREEIKSAVFGNVGSLMCFRVGPEDAEFMAKQFEPVFDTNDLINIENYHAFIKLMINGVPSRPFTLKGLPPSGKENIERGEAIRQLSRLKYGKVKEAVDKEIQEKLAIGQNVEMPGGLPQEKG